MIRKIASILKAIASKPIDVVLFRGFQELRLEWLYRSGGWARLGARAEALGRVPLEPTLLYPAQPNLTAEQRSVLATRSKRVIASDFEIFGHAVPKLENCDFSSDWRHGYSWDQDYFKKYSFYQKSRVPCDVKMPWELSRLAFLVPVLAQLAMHKGDPRTIDWVAGVLQRWDRENPLAYSVNWYPMEASMRAINLVFLLDLTRLALRHSINKEYRAALEGLMAIVAQLLYKNAFFVWYTREYTDVRGNHFTANLVALYLAGRALDGAARESTAWQKYSRARLPCEVRLQFLGDGVNFEKAAGYHKLVLELFALAAIAAEREKAPFPSDCLELLEKAASFCDAMIRPDGLAANFGDSDDACAIPFSMGALRSHGPVVELVRAWRDKPLGAVRFDNADALAALFLTGRVCPAPQIPERPEVYPFEQGGFYIARDQRNGFFFMADMGEVGMQGRGGHGHNDFLSFELFIDGEPVVLDPGCSGYTADLKKKAFYKSTAAHSTVQLFGCEMADLTGPWTISGHASPRGVSFERTPDGFVLQGCHDGYSRLHEGSTVCRSFTVDLERQSVRICDDISVGVTGECAAWHFPTGRSKPKMQEEDDGCVVVIGPTQLSSDLELQLQNSLFSEGYAQEFSGHVIYAKALLKNGHNKFTFEYKRLR